MRQPFSELAPKSRFEGAGVYAIYYTGDFDLYRPIVLYSQSVPEDEAVPIYVGKAVPDGARKGGSLPDESPGAALYERLKKHARSIGETANLALGDFQCRYLAVDSIWIPLGETLLIDRFSPLWNLKLEGFGNNDPGSGRHAGKRSPWDVIHPGRLWASKLQAGKAEALIVAEIQAYLAQRFPT